MLVSVIIPVFNEEECVGETIRKIQEVKLPDGVSLEIIIVDDGSTDKTPSVLTGFNKYANIILLRLKDNKGKTNALRYGISKASGGIIIIQDADLEYDPQYYPQVLKLILDKKEKVVYGSRFKGHIRKMALINRLANIFSNFTLNCLFGASISDVNTGLKAFDKEVFSRIEIVSEKFTFETEVTVKVLKAGYRIREIPIDYTARTRKKGKKITWLDAFKMYQGIVRFWLK